MFSSEKVFFWSNSANIHNNRDEVSFQCLRFVFVVCKTIYILCLFQSHKYPSGHSSITLLIALAILIQSTY